MNTIISCEADQWTLVANDWKQGRVRINSENPREYYIYVAPTGGAAPTERKLVGMRLSEVGYDFQYRSGSDIYIYPIDADGEILLSDDAPYMDTYVQDQITPAVIAKFNQVQNYTTISSETAIGDTTIDITTTTGFTAGRYIVLFSSTTDRFYLGTILSIDANTITIDSPLDSVFPVGSTIGASITNMNVNGSVTSQVFGLRGSSMATPINQVFDVTRIMFKCLTSSACSLATFGNITALTKGLVLRKRDGVYNNIFNIKSNADMAHIMYDFQIIAASNPVQGQDGFTGRLTFAGQSKIGVVVRLEAGDDLEVIIQDNLTGITNLEIIAEGHIVE